MRFTQEAPPALNLWDWGGEGDEERHGGKSGRTSWRRDCLSCVLLDQKELAKQSGRQAFKAEGAAQEKKETKKRTRESK